MSAVVLTVSPGLHSVLHPAGSLSRWEVTWPCGGRQILAAMPLPVFTPVFLLTTLLLLSPILVTKTEGQKDGDPPRVIQRRTEGEASRRTASSACCPGSPGSVQEAAEPASTSPGPLGVVRAKADRSAPQATAEPS